MSLLIAFIAVQIEALIMYRILRKSFHIRIPIIFLWTQIVFVLSIFIGIASYGASYLNGGEVDYIIDYDRHHMDMVDFSKVWIAGAYDKVILLDIVSTKYGLVRYIMSLFYVVFGTEPVMHVIINFASTFSIIYFTVGIYSNLGLGLKKGHVYVLFIFPFFLVQSTLFRDLFTAACLTAYLYFVTSDRIVYRVFSSVFALISIASRFINILFVSTTLLRRGTIAVMVVSAILIVLARGYIIDGFSSITGNDHLTLTSFSLSQYFNPTFIAQRIVGPFPWTQMTTAVNKEVIWQDMLHGSLQLSVVLLLFYKLKNHAANRSESFLLQLGLLGLLMLFFTPDVHVIYNLVPSLLLVPLFRPITFLKMYTLTSIVLFLFSMVY